METNYKAYGCSLRTLERALFEKNKVGIKFTDGEGKQTQYRMERFSDESKQLKEAFRGLSPVLAIMG